MSDKFQPIAMEKLCAWIFGELDTRQSVFGLPRDLFFRPVAGEALRQTLYGQALETPFGVAAGPHSQMAQNLIVAWLCGARFMELKTVQTLDELNVSKPCIDMQDEGYNVEWSQELKVQESFEEYLRAWVLIHALHRKLGLPGDRPGVIFNMSVGYNLEGIQQPNVQEFLRNMQSAGELRQQYIEIVARHLPEARELDIPDRLSDNVTLSTMHGCPPAEIGKISRYLMEEWGLHTNVKLNPTLLGPERVRYILHECLGFTEINVPDSAFGHDLKYPDAVALLTELRGAALEKGVAFGVKLSNTLEVVNHRRVFGANEKMMYLSGRPLHAVTVNLAARLSEEFEGDLPMSFAGGADAFNVADLLACGFSTITSCSDLLRSGGYTRLLQYVENSRAALQALEATKLQEYICRTARRDSAVAAALTCAGPRYNACPRINLANYADRVLRSPLLAKDTYQRARTKTARALDWFDCIKAPCTDECPINQKVPQYMSLVREGRFEEAVEITREDNPLPTILGRACNHLCECTCVRTHYDEPLAIREMKRFIMAQEKKPHFRHKSRTRRKAAIAVIGAGPCGLSTAYFLAQAGYRVTVFEARAKAGGMITGTIPGYRAGLPAVLQDLRIIQKLGVTLEFGKQAGRDFALADLQRDGFRYVVIATGAQQGARLGVAGEDGPGVYDALDFLRAAREGHAPALGERVGVIGGGDVAMDCARTAWRLTHGQVKVVYRRTRREMPAEREEVTALLEEGIELLELSAPKRVERKGSALRGLVCSRMQLGEPDDSGRRRPVDVPGSEWELPLDSLIVAISQQPDLGFFRGQTPRLTPSGYIDVQPDTLETSIPGVFAGGDIGPQGPASIVKALGDGRRIARAIRAREEKAREKHRDAWPAVDYTDLLRRRAHREFRVPVPHRPASDRSNFEEIVLTLSEPEARREAARCLDCHALCSLCAGVCPNLAIQTYRTTPWEARLPVLRMVDRKLKRESWVTFRVDQPFQVAVLTDFCNECGNCVTFCPTAGRPYRDKPRLYLKRAEFEAETDNAFMVFRKANAWTLLGKFKGDVFELVLNGDLAYASPRLLARLDPATFKIKELKPTSACLDGQVLSLEPCARMYALLRGLRESMPYLPAAD